MATLEYAANLARNSSLCVIETKAEPLSGWAAVTGAVNLLTGKPASLDEAVATHLDRLVFYGNNGYGDNFAKQHARRILDDLAAAGVTDRDFIVSALAARGISLYGQKNIGKLIDRRS
ncbi:hypothetical protein EF879_26385 [Micromonospora sp. HM5-17]|nr:hypothetical protein EF879_26385 [Micromonospora sp. HM5-17]